MWRLEGDGAAGEHHEREGGVGAVESVGAASDQGAGALRLRRVRYPRVVPMTVFGLELEPRHWAEIAVLQAFQ